MKILVINTVNFGLNGISKVIMNYYQNMDRNGIEIDFVANDFIDSEFKKIIESNKDHVFLLSHRKKRPFRYIMQLRKILKKKKYDIIHIHGNSALMQIELYAIGRYPAIKLVHAHNTQCTYYKLHKILYKKFMKSYDFALACSDAAGKWLYGQSHYMVFNNGIETAKFGYNEKLRINMRNKLGLNGKFVLLHVGVFNEQKNHAFILDIFNCLQNIIPNSVLILVGNGPLFDRIKMKADKLGLSDKIFFAGETHDVTSYFMAADVFVMPSKFESLGIVNIEAQCSGLKCVVSDNVPASANITSSMDFLSLDTPPEKWALHISQYASGYNRKDCSQIVSEKGFSITDNAQKLKNFYCEICKGKN